MKKIRKRVIAAVLAGIIAVGSATSASAYVWYSDRNFVYFYQSTPTIRLKKIWTTSTFTRSIVEGWASSAATDWRGTNSSYPIPNTFTAGAATGDINIYAAKPQTLYDQLTIDMTGTNGNVSNGRTLAGTRVLVDTITINGVTKKIYCEEGATIYLTNKQSSGTLNGTYYNSRTDIGHQNTIKHELGHALGYTGHSDNLNDLMKNASSSQTTIENVTMRDRQHLGQFVNYNSSASSFINQSSVEENYYIDNENASKGDLDFLINTTNYVDNIIVGTPVKVLKGSLECLDEEDEDCMYLPTDYLFKVSNYCYGFRGDSYITVRSQVGNIFEIGKTYTFSARRLNNTLYDIYTINSRKWRIQNDKLNPSELSSFYKTVSQISMPAFISKEVIEDASVSDSFAKNVDIAFIATVNDIDEDEYNSVYDIYFSDVHFMKGDISDSIIKEGIRIKDKLTKGNEYLFLLSKNCEGCLMPAARNGSAVDVKSIDFEKYIDMLKFNDIHMFDD